MFSKPHFHDDGAARKYLQSLRWPDGAVCPHCGERERRYETKREGRYRCGNPDCRMDFSATTGTVLEASKIPLHKWMSAFYLMTSSKKGVSAHQIHRTVGVTYKSAWFMCHRIREAMRDLRPGPLGGTNKVVEADETVVGGKAKNRAYGKTPPRKTTVMSLIERGGRVRSFHIANVSARTLRPLIVTATSRKSHLMSDELLSYFPIGKEFAGHSTVNHSANEYVRLGGFVHVNTAENYFSIFKRGVFGIFHHISEAHMHRYLAEFDFRYSNRAALGVTDGERAVRALKGIEGKRLTYRQPVGAALR